MPASSPRRFRGAAGCGLRPRSGPGTYRRHDQVMAAICLGMPVLCEKPLASTVAQCREIVEVDVGRNLGSVCFMRRFDPACREMKTALDAGRIGAPLLIHCVHRNRESPRWFDSSMNVTRSIAHEFDIRRWLLDTEHTSAALTQIGDANDMLLAELRTDRRAVVSVEMFMNAAYGYHVHAEVVGREGTVAMAEPAQVGLRRGGAMQAGYSPTGSRALPTAIACQPTKESVCCCIYYVQFLLQSCCRGAIVNVAGRESLSGWSPGARCGTRIAHRSRLSDMAGGCHRVRYVRWNGSFAQGPVLRCRIEV